LAPRRRTEVPWVADDAARQAHEVRLAPLVGRRILAARYFEGANEGVLASAGPLIGHHLREDGRYGVYDVTGQSGWPAVVGRPIEAVDAAWTTHEWDPPRDGALCVVTWLLRLSAGGNVVITLGGRSPEGRLWASPDEVSVFFSLAAAERHGVLLPGGDDG